ncbi:MAG TPA: hypothetical protein VGB75_10090 [Jatrophihabitans sp.]|jgi:hypothetical protein|uniref:hypothetical protein n=1 Tax=Jatrophihabitans sp. TaxID=1932789 RepID=UPI002EFF6143
MVARLSVRLLAVLLFAAAMSVAQPAHASTLTVNSATCAVTGYYAPDPANYGTFSCTATASGGTGSYSYSWTVFSWCCGDSYYGSGPTITGNCKWGTARIFTVYVTDSSGAMASKGATVNCTRP